MHYFQFHIGDYRADTAHLSNDEDLTYRRLLEMYYDTEKPILLDIQSVARRLRCNSTDIKTVLEDFFILQNDGWHHNRCNNEIEYYRQQLTTASKAGKASALKRALNKNPTGVERTLNDGSTDVQPTNNHKPITNNQLNKAQRGSRLAQDWVLTKSLGEWAQAERPDLDVRLVAEQFKDYWIAQPGQKGVKLDWSATWRNWVRNSKAAKPNPADIIRLTVPASNEPDPALAKIKADEKTTRPPTQAEREMLASLRRKS